MTDQPAGGARAAASDQPRLRRTDQLSPTSAARTTLPGTHGPLAALVATAGRPAGTVLLLPGYTGSKEDFAPILDPLAAAGLTAVTVDLPGQHESEGSDEESEYTPARLGEEAAALVERLRAGGPVLLLGHSFGGLVARGAVLAGAPVAGLVLLCSGPSAFRYGERYDALIAGEPLMREHGHEVAYDLAAAEGQAARKAPTPEMAEFLRQRFVSSRAASLLGMGAALRTEPDRVDELAAVLQASRIPVAVIAGTDDDAWPLPDQREMAVRLGTELVIIPDAAHSPAVENPAALLAVLLPLLHGWLSVTTPTATDHTHQMTAGNPGSPHSRPRSAGRRASAGAIGPPARRPRRPPAEPAPATSPDRPPHPGPPAPALLVRPAPSPAGPHPPPASPH